MQHFLLFGLLISVVLSQECGAAPPTTKENMPPQKVAYVQIETTGQAPISAIMKRGYDILQNLIKNTYKTSTVTMFYCKETAAGGCLSGIDLASYTQVWVNDNSGGADNEASQADGYRKIASWYTTTMALPHLICDGRIRSSLWDGRNPAFSGAVPVAAGNRPNEKYIENIFINLGIRGGGMFLGTDHAPAWTEGINEIARQIGISLFSNNFADEPWALALDTRSPVMTYPNDASEFTHAGNLYLWDDSTTSDSPISEQRNGQILYPIGWHNAIGFNRPGVSTTIRGGVGFLVEITSPKCNYMSLPNQKTTFSAKKTSGDFNVATWTWTSNLDGVIGTGDSISVQLSPGQHTVTLRAVDSQRFVATAKVIVVQIYNSGKAECIMFSQDGAQVREYFPLQRKGDAVSYYSYNKPKPGANTADRLEDMALSSNFFLYDDGDNANGLHLIMVNSKNAGPATISYKIGTSVKPTPPSIKLVDANGDRFLTYDPATQTGLANFGYQAATKGFVLGPFPNVNGSKWCFDLTLDTKTLQGIKTINTWGHVRDSPKYPSPVTLSPSTSAAGDTKVFQFCRISCNCAGVEKRVALSGSIDPVRVNPGAGGNIGQTYTGGVLCTWSIQPGAPAKRSIEAIAGINIFFSPKFDINPSDSLTILEGNQNGVVKLDHATGKTVPAPIYIKGPEATVVFQTTAAIKTEFGWSISYSVQPTIISLAPVRGVNTESTTVTVTGTEIDNDPQARVKIVTPGGDILLPVVWKSSTSFTVVVPPGNPGTFPLYYTNNVGSGNFAGPLNFTLYDASCSDIKTCAGCAAKPSCNFCNNLQNPKESFCYGVGGEKVCPVDNAAAFKNDAGCCSGCNALNHCSNGGKCQCNDTCLCDEKHWGPDCSCLQCPKGSNGKICSGFGECNCDGTCTCDRLHRELDCGCLKCEGEPGPCSGHGSCNCDGSCTCNEGWTHLTPLRKVCDCSTVCEGNCSGHGECKCGVCDCNPGYKLLPDCSCKDCETTCSALEMCNCDGKCQCLPGRSGPDCMTRTDCGSKTDCASCLEQSKDCGWCDEAKVCENKHELVKCSKFDKKTNPRGFFLTTDPLECPVGTVVEQDIVSDSMSSIMAAAIVGSVGTAAAGLAAMAYFLRAPPVEAFGTPFEPASGPGAFMESAIYVGGSGPQASGIAQ